MFVHSSYYKQPDSRFQEPIAVPIHNRDGRRVGDADMVRLDADELPILAVGVVDAQIPSASTGLQQQPHRRELGGEGAGHVSDRSVGGEVGHEEEEEESSRESVGREEEVENRHFWRCRQGGG